MGLGWTSRAWYFHSPDGNDELSHNAGQKYCRMLQREHSAIYVLSPCIKLPFVIKIVVLSIFEWPFYTGFTV